MNIIKNTLQVLAIKYLRMVDSNQLIYCTLKTLPLAVRLIFYIGFPVFTFFILKALSQALISLEFITINPMFGFLVDIAFTSIFLLSLLFVLYEAIYKTNVDDILEDIKAKKKEIKHKKLEWWRLRNYPFWMRALIYIFLYVISINVIQTQAMITLTQVEDLGLHYNLTVISQAKRDFDEVVQWVSISFVLFSILSEWYLARNRATNHA